MPQEGILVSHVERKVILKKSWIKGKNQDFPDSQAMYKNCVQQIKVVQVIIMQE